MKTPSRAEGKKWAIAGALFVVMGLGLCPSAVGAQKCHVLSVGVNKYQAPSIPPLRGAVADAQAVADQFRGDGAAVKTLLDEQATGDAIWKALDEVENRSVPGDRVVLYFSGHGSRKAGEFRFVPHDAVRLPQSWGDKEKETRLELRDHFFPQRVIALAESREVVLIVDACHAGQIHGALAPALNRQAGGGLVLLTSSVAGQKSVDGTAHGRFTLALLEAFAGRADADGDGVITLKEVRRYLHGRMKTLEVEGSRIPGLPFSEQDFVCDASYSVSELLPLGRVRGKVPPPAQVKWVTAPAVKPIDAAKVGPGTWKARLSILNSRGEPATDREGKPLRQTYTLELQRDSVYTVVWDGDLGAEAGAGRWEYVAHDRTVRLVSATGTDVMQVVTLAPDSIEVRIFRHGTYRMRTTGEIPFDRIEIEFDDRHPPQILKLDR